MPGGKTDAGRDGITSKDGRGGKETSVSSAGSGGKGTELVTSFDLPMSFGRLSQASSSVSYGEGDE